MDTEGNRSGLLRRIIKPFPFPVTEEISRDNAVRPDFPPHLLQYRQGRVFQGTGRYPLVHPSHLSGGCYGVSLGRPEPLYKLFLDLFLGVSRKFTGPEGCPGKRTSDNPDSMITGINRLKGGNGDLLEMDIPLKKGGRTTPMGHTSGKEGRTYRPTQEKPETTGGRKKCFDTYYLTR